MLSLSLVSWLFSWPRGQCSTAAVFSLASDTEWGIFVQDGIIWTFVSVGSFPTSQFDKRSGWSWGLLSPPSFPVRLVLTSISSFARLQRLKLLRVWSTIYEKEFYYLGNLCMLILSLLPNSVYLRVRHVRQEIGEWRAWSKPWKGVVNFVRVGSVGYLQKGSKRVFWGCRSVLHLFHKWILVEILTKVPVVNTTNARWSDQGFHVQLD